MANSERKLEEAMDFAENPEPRCACVLLLDTSGSMQGEPIAALNEGLRAFRDALNADPLASLRVEPAMVTFDSEVKLVSDFVTADKFEPPTLTASGMTAMGTAIQKGLDIVEARKQVYRANKRDYFRPWILMISDGEPQGEPDEVVKQAAARIKRAEEDKRALFYAIGVEGANMKRLETIAVRPPMKLQGLKFVELFQWLSKSFQATVRQSPDDKQVGLPPITAGPLVQQ